jgi:PAS domain S-box-containing protein
VATLRDARQGRATRVKRGGASLDATADSLVLQAPAGVLHGLRDAVVAVDGRGTVRFANEGIRALLGREPAQVVGHPITTIVPPEHAGAFLHDHGEAEVCPGRRLRLAALRHDLTEVDVEGTSSCARLQGSVVVVGILRAATELL